MKHRVKISSAVIANLLILPILLLSLNSCKRFVELPPPTTMLASSNVFTDNSTANAAQLVIYSQMTNKDVLSYYISLLSGLSADDYTNYSSLADYQQYYKNALDPQNSYNYKLWTALYNYIYEANANLEGLSSSVNVTGAVKNQLIGEAKFVRAYCYFYLCNLYGDVPLITTTNYQTNLVSKRNTTSDIYKQIIADLTDAKANLSDNYLGADALTISSERVRPTKWAASALLARAYLYTNDWTNAENQASSVINFPSLYKLVGLSSAFTKNSYEAIWQLIPTGTSTVNTYDGLYFILTGAPSNNFSNCVAISNSLLNSFESGDNRRTAWIGSIMAGPVQYNFPNKYKVISNSTISEYTVCLRLSEQYLIRAEARANGAGPGLTGAIADVDTIRVRAGLPIYSGPVTKDSVMRAILRERRTELFSEWGHRWFDLKRTGAVDSTMTIASPQKGGSWSTYKQLWPIPQTERNNDVNLSQNQGY